MIDMLCVRFMSRARLKLYVFIPSDAQATLTGFTFETHFVVFCFLDFLEYHSDTVLRGSVLYLVSLGPKSFGRPFIVDAIL